MKRITVCLFLFWPLAIWSQTANLEQKVTFEYINVSLEEVLRTVSNDYKIYFSYSKDFIALEQKVKWRADNIKLNRALDRLFNHLNIAYKSIGDQLVLKKKASKKRLIKKSKPKNQKKDLGHSRKIYPKVELPKPLWLETYEMETLEPPDQDYPTMAEMDFVVPAYAKYKITSLDETRLAQVSLFPSFGTNFEDSEDITNNMSLNIFWGSNGGVNGLEIGGFVNTVKGDVNGVQIAGWANVVEGDVGSSDWIDEHANIETRTGVQVAGLVNVAQNVQAVQVAGLANWTRESFVGVQAAGFGNYVGGNAKGFQFGGFYNINRGHAGSQVASMINIAEDVAGFQFGGLFNKAKHVKKFQAGLINVCDSIDGTTYGLINWVKGGSNSYNRLEISGNELLHLGMSVKMGVPAFYNMFHLGMRFNPGIEAWGIGYGVGTLRKWNRKVDINIELSAIHINEGRLWTKELNMWLNLRLLFNRRFGKHHSIFFGPTFNVMISKLSDPAGEYFGSQIVPYSLFKARLSDGEGAQLINWIGFSVGFRF